MWRQEGGGLVQWCRDVGKVPCPWDAHPGRGAGTLQQSRSRAWLFERLDRSGPADPTLSLRGSLPSWEGQQPCMAMP